MTVCKPYNNSSTAIKILHYLDVVNVFITLYLAIYLFHTIEFSCLIQLRILVLHQLSLKITASIVSIAVAGSDYAHLRIQSRICGRRGAYIR